MSIVDGQDDLTDCEKHACGGLGFVSCVYILYSCRNVLKVHRYLYFSIYIEQTLHFLQAFLVKTLYGHLGTLIIYAVQHIWSLKS